MQKSVVLVLILCCFLFSGSLSIERIWVSDQGDNSYNGTETYPLKTLQGALNFAQNKSIVEIDICLKGDKLINGIVNFTTINFTQLNISGCEETQSSLFYEVTDSNPYQIQLDIAVFSNLRLISSGQNLLVGNTVPKVLFISKVNFEVTMLAMIASTTVIDASNFDESMFLTSENIIISGTSFNAQVYFLGISSTSTLTITLSNFIGLPVMDIFSPKSAIFIESFTSVTFEQSVFKNNKAGIFFKTFSSTTLSFSKMVFENNTAIGTSYFTMNVPQFVDLQIDDSLIGCNYGPQGPIYLFPQALYNNLEVRNTNYTCGNVNPPTPKIPGSQCSFLGACVACPVGSFSFNNTCVDCPAGTFAYEPSSSNCLACVGNSISASGSSVCTLCDPVDKKANEKHTICVPTTPAPTPAPETEHDSTYLILLIVVNIVFFSLVALMIFFAWKARTNRQDLYILS